MASAFYVSRHYNRMHREKSMENARKRECFVKDVLRCHGGSNDCELKFCEVRSWLCATRSGFISEFPGKVLGNDFPGISQTLSVLESKMSSASIGFDTSAVKSNEETTDDEVTWVIKHAMDKRSNGSFRKKVMDEQIDVHELTLHISEFMDAFDLWRGYLRCKPILEKASQRYGADNDGRMGRDSIRFMLKELGNDDTDPRDCEVDWIMQVPRLLRASTQSKIPAYFSSSSVFSC